MAIKIQGVTVIDDNRDIVNIRNVEIDGNSGLKLPSGTQAQRPETPATGTIRFNTDTSSIEVFDGTSFGSVGGGGSSITSTTLFYISGI